MAKTKKRTAGRKKSAKRGKASVKPARKKTAKRAIAKKAKAKVRRTTKRVTKPTLEEKPASAETLPIFAEATAETAVVTVIEEPTRPVVVVEEQVSVRATSDEENGSARPADISSDLADTGSDLGELQEQKVA
jgi:hypothetical protein